MMCIWLESVIVVVGTLLLFSLAVQPCEAETDAGPAVTRWTNLFAPIIFCLFGLTIFGLFSFLNLASRVVKIKFSYCDDDLTGVCMVRYSWWWTAWLVIFGVCLIAICLLHVGITVANKRAEMRMPEELSYSVEKIGRARSRARRLSVRLGLRKVPSIRGGGSSQSTSTA